MVKTLTKLEIKYAIAEHKRKPAMFRRRVKTSHIIPKVFSSIFKHLAGPVDPHDVPSPYPTVDWNAVRFKPALPDPKHIAVQSVSQDPKFYGITNEVSYYKSSSDFSRSDPFGTLPGYHTNHGVVAVPSTAVQGYLYCPDARRWVVAATAGTRGGGTPGSRQREPGEERKVSRYHRLSLQMLGSS